MIELDFKNYLICAFAVLFCLAFVFMLKFRKGEDEARAKIDSMYQEHQTEIKKLKEEILKLNERTIPNQTGLV